MPINHWFLEHNFGNGFATRNAILETTPYEPELLIVGTYNPKTEVNQSDFFYHRNYFWPILFNLFIDKAVVRTKRREYTTPVTPTLNEILTLCANVNVTFADLIKNTFKKEASVLLTGNTVTYCGNSYNLIDDNALARLDELHQVDWSSEDIIKYIKETPSIHCVRLTRQPTGVWKPQWNRIINADYGRIINFGTIHSPSGQGLRERGVNPAKGLARRWLYHPIADKRLWDQWILNHKVPVQNFNYATPPLPLI